MVIGITGSLGVGKTTVAGLFRRLGARVINADRIAHKIIKPGTPAYKRIISTFGRGVLRGNYISRRKLAAIVFSDRQALEKLNRITHPGIIRIIKDEIRGCNQNEVLVIEAALLIEAGLLSRIDKLVVVKSGQVVVKQRLKKSGFSPKQLKARLAVQLSQDKKIRLADYVIDNRASIRYTEEEVKKVWYDIIKNAAY